MIPFIKTMNHGLAIATVTAALRALLSNRLVAAAEANGIGEVSVSALPPDRITTGSDERNQLNVFMHRVSSHTRVRTGTESIERSSTRRRLSLDLYYLVTAYGIQDLHTDILLGLAIAFFHDTPVLSKDMIQEAVGARTHRKVILPPAEAAVAASDFESFDEVRLTPQFTSSEEMSQMWSAMQTRFRPSISYKASAVCWATGGEDMTKARSDGWLDRNHRALSAAIKMVYARLSIHAAQFRGEPDTQAFEDKLQAAVADYRAAQHECSPSPTLDRVCAAFELSSFERDVLLVCAGMELDSGVRTMCIGDRTDPGSNGPSFGLLLSLPGAHWSALAPDSPLRYWKLIYLGTGGSSGAPLTTCPIRIDERILHYLVGLSRRDERLQGLIEPLVCSEELVDSHKKMARELAELWSRYEPEATRPVIRLHSCDAGGARAIANNACACLDLRLFEIATSALPADRAELLAWIRLLERESRLNRCTFLLECDSQPRDSAQGQSLRVVLDRMDGSLIVISSEPQPAGRRPTVQFDIKPPAPSEQLARWDRALARTGMSLNGQLDILVSQFTLNSNDLRSAVDRAACHQGKVSSFEELWEACRTHARADFGGMAQQIDAIATWDDLILPEPQKNVLRDIVMHAKWRYRVHESWGFSRKSSRGLGISVVFAGPSGTGKTMAAEVIARDLQLDLYRIDLSMVVSKYIGETEKNLRHIFQSAERGGAILLFDEADALFGRRSEVKDSHDRYANVEVAYLLQRIETYRGLSILTTNAKGSIDPAFMRRFRFVVQFPFPDAAQRAAIWQRVFPGETPTFDPRCSQAGATECFRGNHPKHRAEFSIFCGGSR